MALLWQNSLTQLPDLQIHAESAEVTTWQGREGLRLENGLALIPAEQLKDGSVEVMIGAEGPAYSGVAFRVVDRLNYELAYAAPHCSGQWDALQYDPVFHGSNTWQIYHGPCYQATRQVPTGQWFHLRLAFFGERAAIWVDGQPPLVVEGLARSTAPGLVGLWTYRPACFSDLRVSSCDGLDVPGGELARAAEGAVDAWFVEGYGAVSCERNGLLNLNRYLPASLREVRLIRRFEMPAEGELTFAFGFSDELSLELDGQELFSGENLFTGFADRAARGYPEPGMESLRQVVVGGTHQLTALLRVSEGFGWGLALAAHGEGLRWLPAEWG